VTGSVGALASAVGHVSGWNAGDWLVHVLLTLLGWVAVGTPVYLMHRMETAAADEPPPPPPPAAPIVAPPDWPRYVLAFGLGLAGTIVGASCGWVTARHINGVFLILAWWMVPFLFCVAVWMYWILDERDSDVGRSQSGWAAAMAGLVYAAVGLLIAGADAITRVAAQAELTSNALIALVLIGILGWVLWLVGPRRRARS
jgi:hypothetical protein